MPDIALIIAVLAVADALLLGGLIDMAHLGIAVRLWGFGPPRATPRPGEAAVLHHRFGKTGWILGTLVGWVFAPYEVFVTNRRFIVNYRNAFARLDIPLDAIRSVRVRRRPWPLADEILIGYSDHGTPKQFFLPDNAGVIIRALQHAGAQFSVEE